MQQHPKTQAAPVDHLENIKDKGAFGDLGVVGFGSEPKSSPSTMELEAHMSNKKQGWLTGSVLVAAITSVCSSAFLVFGYDQGVMSGVVISKIWLAQMGNPSQLMVGTITALYDVGAIAGCIAAAVVGERWGRRRTLVFGCVTVIVGMILMTTCYERIQMMFGRVVTGIGIGFITAGASPVDP